MAKSNQDGQYSIVKNQDEVYSIWAHDRPIPDGWEAIGFDGSKEVCLEEIAGLWADMRPRHLRKAKKRKAKD